VAAASTWSLASHRQCNAVLAPFLKASGRTSISFSFLRLSLLVRVSHCSIGFDPFT
jgi:hypothetical protein